MTQIQSLAAFSPQALGELKSWLEPWFLNTARSTTIPACRAFNSTPFSVPDSTFTAVTFDSERFDTDDIHSDGTNTSRFTCNTPGIYLLGFNAAFATNPANDAYCGLRLNGSTFIGFSGVVLDPVSAHASIAFVTTVFGLAAADYVEAIAYQSSGSAINLSASGDYSPEAFMVRVG